jgi:hypothetical protein
MRFPADSSLFEKYIRERERYGGGGEETVALYSWEDLQATVLQGFNPSDVL